MGEPSREHVEAVGAAIRDEIKKYPMQPKPETYDVGRYSHLTWGATEHSIARAILTSTDPAVLDAMQDALVRAGRLWEETARGHADEDGQGYHTCPCDDRGSLTLRCFATDWQEIPDA